MIIFRFRLLGIILAGYGRGRHVGPWAHQKFAQKINTTAETQVTTYGTVFKP